MDMLHQDLPDIPLDNELLYHFLSSTFSILSLILQYIQIYKTIWWLPQSHTPYALNFYLMDLYLMVYVIIILIKPFIMTIKSKESYGEMFCTNRFTLSKYINAGLNLLFIGLFVIQILSFYYVFQTYDVLRLLFLIYPIFIYLILYHNQIHFNPKFWTSFNLYQICGTFKNENLHIEKSIKHNCMDISVYPAHIYKEINHLNQFIHLNIKNILYNTIIIAYYACFLPCVMAPPIINYNLRDIILLSMIITVTTLAHSIYHTFSYKNVDEIYKICIHFDYIMADTSQNINNHSHLNDKVICDTTNIQESEFLQSPYFLFFKEPTNFIKSLLMLQSTLIACQMYSLYINTEWNLVLSIEIILHWKKYMVLNLNHLKKGPKKYSKFNLFI
ncbi:unnamed protein product [Gordionus sp. m RMFG-2023]